MLPSSPCVDAEEEEGAEGEGESPLETQHYTSGDTRNFKGASADERAAWQEENHCISIAEQPPSQTEVQTAPNKLQRRSNKRSSWRGSLAQFQSRLRWRTHFMQKLYDEPGLDERNMCRSYDAMRNEDALSQEEKTRLDAWLQGRTGFPMVDACMRALHRAGWINFRMRCMLVSFASYDLWLSWKHFAPDLAQLFLDYEPGIHYPQLQMQAGTTGINSNRIYSPSKQLLDHDVDGIFITRYVPELKGVSGKGLLAKDLSVLRPDYPSPIVDSDAAIASARQQLQAFNRLAKSASTDAKDVFQRHGSRRHGGGPGFSRQHLRKGSVVGKDRVEDQKSCAGAHDEIQPVFESQLFNGKDVSSGKDPHVVPKDETHEDSLVTPTKDEMGGADGELREEASHQGRSSLIRVDHAPTARATCRVCAEKLTKGSLRCGQDKYANGRTVTVYAHALCFLEQTRWEYAPAKRGRCQGSRLPFEKGDLRVAFDALKPTWWFPEEGGRYIFKILSALQNTATSSSETCRMASSKSQSDTTTSSTVKEVIQCAKGFEDLEEEHKKVVLQLIFEGGPFSSGRLKRSLASVVKTAPAKRAKKEKKPAQTMLCGSGNPEKPQDLVEHSLPRVGGLDLSQGKRLSAAVVSDDHGYIDVDDDGKCPGALAPQRMETSSAYRSTKESGKAFNFSLKRSATVLEIAESQFDRVACSEGCPPKRSRVL